MRPHLSSNYRLFDDSRSIVLSGLVPILRLSFACCAFELILGRQPLLEPLRNTAERWRGFGAPTLQISLVPSETYLRFGSTMHSVFPTNTVEVRGSTLCGDMTNHVFVTLRVETHC